MEKLKVLLIRCPRYPALVGPVEKDFDKNRLRCDMKAFRLDGFFSLNFLSILLKHTISRFINSKLKI